MRERERSSFMGQLTLQILTTVRPCPGQSQELGLESKSPICVAGTQVLDLSLLSTGCALAGRWNEEWSWNLNPSTQYSMKQSQGVSLIAVPKTQPGPLILTGPPDKIAIGLFI